MNRLVPVLLTAFLLGPAAGFSAEKVSLWEAKGMFHFARGEYPQALKFFKKIHGIDSKNEQNLYHLGTTHLKLKNYRKASRFFKKLFEEHSGSELSLLAEKWMAEIEQAVAQTKEPRKKKRWNLKGSASSYYDSNVTLDPDNQNLDGFSDRDDFMAVGTLDLNYFLVNQEKTQFYAGYSGYQSAHWNALNIDANRFNYGSHRVGLGLTRKLNDHIRWTVPGDYNFVTLGKAKYLQSGAMESILDMMHMDHWMLSVTAGVRRDWFYQSLNNTAQNRDATQPYARLEEYFFAPHNREVYFKAGYGFEKNLAGGNDWDFSAHHALYAIHFPIWWRIKFLMAGDVVVRRNFDRTDSVFNVLRRDKSLYHTVVFSKDLLRFLRIAASYSFFIRDSTLARYTYRRHVAGLTFSTQL
ncbi:MAG: hypothetical protein HY466_07520 [Deltaproteobacteria bacterium]|nr:hypothetical protein [Deltaproteobacteria bacterium]